MEEPRFRADLYRGTAEYYDRYRVAYPAVMFDDLAARARLTGSGRLLDLACGPGPVTFGLCSRFSTVWAVDQEEEMVLFARAKAARLGVSNVTWITGPAEGLDVAEPFDLITIGNAFHRLPRRRLAASAFDWLVPGGHLALIWSGTPNDGEHAWQGALTDVMQHWAGFAGASDRLPAEWEAAMAHEPNLAVLAGAGFDVIGTFDFVTPHAWTVEDLIGFLYSTSVHSVSAMGEHAGAMEQDLRARLLRLNRDGRFEQEITFCYQLVRRGTQSRASVAAP